MTIKQFREHEYFPVEFRRLLRTSGILQRVLQTLEENHPDRYAINGDKNEDVSPTRASIELGVTRGYSKALDTIRMLAEPVKKSKDIGETTYEKENAETNDET